MIPEIIGAVTAFVTGAAISYLSYLLSRQMLVKSPERYSAAAIVRQLIQIGFLAGAFFITRAAGVDILPVMLAAVLGITLPMLFFTFRLLKLNKSLDKGKAEERKDSDG